MKFELPDYIKTPLLILAMVVFIGPGAPAALCSLFLPVLRPDDDEADWTPTYFCQRAIIFSMAFWVTFCAIQFYYHPGFAVIFTPVLLGSFLHWIARSSWDDWG